MLIFYQQRHHHHIPVFVFLGGRGVILECKKEMKDLMKW